MSHRVYITEQQTELLLENRTGEIVVMAAPFGHHFVSIQDLIVAGGIVTIHNHLGTILLPESDVHIARNSRPYVGRGDRNLACLVDEWALAQ